MLKYKRREYLANDVGHQLYRKIRTSAKSLIKINVISVSTTIS